MKNAARLFILFATLSVATAARADAQQLGAAISRFSGAWRQNDDRGVAALVAREGVTIETEDEKLGPLSPRQAAAVLRSVFDNRNTRGVATRQMQDVGGSPQKAYAEVIWTTIAPETTEAMRVIVFVEWVLEKDNTWRITRIRLLSP